MKYAVVIPAKNEEENIENTVESIIHQTLPPECVLIIDDGSTDETLNILKSLEEKYENLKHIVNPGDKEYKLGGHVVRLFNKGVKELKKIGFLCDWYVKLDADLSFPSDTMERMSNAISPVMGIVSATPYFFENGKNIFEISPDWHTHGQFKVYNNLFLNKVVNIPESLGWDTADNIKAMSLGFKTATIKDVNYLMHRKIGGKSSLKKGRINHGTGCYVLSYSKIYFFIKAFHDLFKEPYIVGVYYLILGYVRAHFQKPKKILTLQEASILRSLLWNSLFKRFKNREFILLQKMKK